MESAYTKRFPASTFTVAILAQGIPRDDACIRSPVTRFAFFEEQQYDIRRKHFTYQNSNEIRTCVDDIHYHSDNHCTIESCYIIITTIE